MMEATMKSFKEYLTESKKTYEFKVKIAGNIPKDFATNLKTALGQFQVEGIKNAKRTPIQESPVDFPNAKFSEVTVFDVVLKYPCNSPTVAGVISEKLGINSKNVVVKTIGEEEESIINLQHMHGVEASEDANADEALLNTPFQASSNQHLVVEEQKLSFLKSLESKNHGLKEVTGTNDQLFAGMPKSTAQEQQSKVADGKPSLLTRQVKLSPVSAGGKPITGKGK
jgi:hypothetical protein